MNDKKMAQEDLNQLLLESSKRLSTQTLMFHQAVASYLNLNITDHKCLDIILGMSKATAGQLAELTGLTTGAITSAINRLEKAGYVRRVKDPNDLRIVIVEPIYSKLHVIKEVFAPLSKAMTQLHSEYHPSELMLILEYLEKSRQILWSQTEQLKMKTK